MSINELTGILSGIPQNADVGTTQIVIIATDSGGLTTSTTFSLTVINTNDPVSITAATNPAAIPEIAGDSSAQDIAAVTGTITVSDQDLGDTLTLSVTGNATASYNGGAVPIEDSVDISALIAAGAISFAPATSNGESVTVNWTYDPAAADLDWLRAGDTLVLTYTARVNDGAGNVGAQALTITITGTNDVPAITAATNPAAIPEIAGDSSAQDIAAVTGTITVSDQDLGDTLTLSVTGNATASYNGGAVPIEDSVDISALIAAGAISFAPATSNGESVTVNWTYDPAAADLDWLRAGDTLVLTYTARVNDGAGNVGAQALTITITGTNDVPAITAATNPAAIPEIAGDSSAQDIAAVTGTITVSDQDLGDTLTLSVTGNATASYNGGAVPIEDSVDISALIAAGAISFAPATSNGESVTVNWTYDPAAADLDWLRAGDTLVLTYTARVNDGAGNVGAQALTITITGTNDVPAITAATNPAAIPEIAGDSSAQDIAAVTGTITVSDQDLGDTLTLSVTGNATASYNGGAVPIEDSVDISALIAAGAISFAPATSNGESVTVNWTYDPAAADLDWLRAGDTLVLTYTARVNDGAGNVGAQALTITITGTNDVPAITAATNPAAIPEIAGDSSAQDIAAVTGTITVSDQDLGDTLTLSVTGNATASYNGGAVPIEDSVDISALIAAGAISFAPATSNGESVTVNWTYDPAAADLDWLRAGDTLVLTYTARVNDGAGNVGAQALTITITGTNDVPAITAATNPAAIPEIAGDSSAQDIAAVTGTITVSDQDLGDTLTLSVTGNATASYNGGAVPIEDSVDISALIAAGAISFAPATSNGESVTVNWTYDPAAADLDWLRAGDTLVLTYTARVNDGAGNVGAQALTITITGTNDVPAITAATNPAAIPEIAGDSSAQDIAAVTGTITVSDQDLGDTLTLSVTGNATASYNGGAVPIEDSVDISALIAAGAISFAPATSNGESVTVNWTYDPAAADLDWLRAGDTLVLTYTARVNDGAGNVGAQALTITITGTNDVPAITAATNPAAIPEIAGDSSAQDIAAVTGTITVSDQDLGDTLTLSVTGNATASYNGGAVPIEDSVDISALIAAGAISFAPATSNGESVTVNWTYDPAAADLDWLRAGDTLVLTYTARVNDGAGNVGAQALTITITGTNDVPAITAATNPAAIPEIAGDSSAQDIAAVTGTITVSDQDLGDTLTLSVTGNATASYNGGAVPIEDSVDISALIAAGAISFAPATSNGESVTVNWTYDPAAADLDWLRAGDTLVLTYTARVNDGAGNVGAQALTITITGTNDVPAITAATNPAAIPEIAGDSSAQDIAAVTGTITVSDQDLGDTLTLSVTGNATASYNGGAVPIEDSVDISALIAAGAISFAPATSNGESVTVNWTYDPAAADLDWLRAGDTLVLTYTARVNDGAGNVGAQALTITITGTNDVPAITAATNPAAIPEIAGDSSAQDIAAVTGTITVSDQDLGDTLTLSVTGNATASYNGGAVPIEDSVDISALIAAGAISFAPATSNGESVTVNWTYDPAAADLDWLRAGDTLVLTYTARVNDGAGNVGAQALTITITGTNDVPAITAATNPAAIPEIAGDSSAQDIAAVTGTITVSDQDLGDTLTLSVTGNATASYNGGAVPIEDSVDISALIAAGAISFAPATSNGESVTVNWTYDPAAADLDWLRAGDTLVLTYTARVNDGAGNVGAQALTITITGTNDVPAITAATNPAAIPEIAGDSSAQDIAAVTGTITVSDQDLGDTLTLSVTGNATASYNGGAVPIEDSVDISALIAAGAISFAPATSNGESVTVNWTYDPAAADLDWLRAGDTLVLTYTARVNDGAGNVGAQALTITITGTNDVPAITAATNPAAIPEIAGDSSAQDIAAVTGTITVSDQDLGDTLTLSVTGNATASYNGGAVPIEDSVDISALIAAGAISFAPATSNGESVTVNWTYDPAAADLDWLRAGDTLVLTYTARVNDGAGNVGAQALTITITGTNDVPAITAATNPAAIPEIAGDSSAQDIAAVTGTITVSDQDLGDTLTLSVTGNATASYNGGAVPIEDSVDISALIAAGAISFAPATSNGESVTVNWTYDPAAADLDWLRAGDTLVLTYTARVNDGAGNVGAQALTITITGTNDVPAITAATNPAAIPEIAGDSSAQDIAAVTGTITVSDQDLGDTLTLSVTGNATASYNGGAVPIEDSVDISALIAAGAISFAPATSNGESVTVNWTYDPAAADLDWLRAGDTLVLTYTARVNDGAGNVGAQALTITITGTNDVPAITAATNPAAIPEIAGDSSAQDIAAVTGTITVSDQDLGDTLTLSVTGNATASYNGGAVPIEDSVDISALIAAGAISFAPATSNGESVTVNWTYDPAAADLDWLRAGDTLVLTYTARVNDGAGNVGAQALTITITGTNDVPAITAATNPAAIPEIAGDSSAQDIAAVTGTITVSDQDLGDTLTLSVTGNATASYNGGAVPIEDSVDISALIAAGAISFAPATSNGESVTVNWTYDPAAADLDWLRAGDTLVLTYTARVNDGAGNVGAQALTITITGTNDVPAITAATNPAAIPEIAGDSSAQDIAAVTGTITVSDQDLGDTLTLSVTGNATASYNGGAVPIEDSVDISALIAAGAISFAPATSNGESVTVNWTYDPAAADLDWLRAGDTLVLTYTARVNDGAGNVGAQALTITITGTNDVPAITAATNPAAIPEIAGDSSAQDIAAVTGTITVSDQDLGDTLTLSVTGNATASYNGGAVPIEDSVDISALIAAGAISFAPATSNGESVTVNWTYDPAAADLDWLRAGDTLVLTYTARVNDGAGNVGAQALTITITGTNDVPVAVADTNSTDPIVEGAGYGASLVPADSTAVGNVLANDTDEDLGETAQLRVTQIATGPTTAVVAPGTNATTGTVIVGTYGSLTIGANGTWAYQLDDADFDTQALIGNGTEVFTYTIVDPQGATATATLTLTITGTADGIFTEAADTLDLNAFINLPAGGWDGINNPTLTGTLSALGGNDDITLASTAPTAWSGLTTFTGGEGDDTIRLSEGYIGLDGGNGTDLADFSSATDVVVATLDGTYEVGSSGAQALTAFENLNGGTQSDVLTGNNGANIINGRDGDDQIDGGAGDDTLNGEGNSDLILGGSGLDTIDGGDGDDDIAGGADNDTINAGAGDDIIRYQVGTDGQDVINGGADDDELVVTGTTGNQNITVTVPAIATPTSFNVNLGPPSGNEIAASNVETLTIDAVSGTNDRLQITGANGGSAADTITASGTLTNFTVDVNGGLSVNGLNFDRLTLSGSGGDDTLDASAFLSNIFLNGNAGNDTLLGGSGNDTISGAGGRDVIVGGEGNDALTGGNDQDIFLYTFGDGLDSVVGGEGNMATDLDTVIAGGTAAGFGHATVDILGVEAFDIDLDSDSTTEISATEIEAIELFSSASTGSHVLTILGRDIDNDPPSANMPGDERLIVENSGTGGILITLAENGETILGEGFEQLLIDGRQGDDEIDLQGLLSTSNGLDAAIADVTILGGAGSDRIVVGENTRTLTVIGGETADAAFGGDAVQVIDGGNTRVTLRGDDSFEIDFKDDPALDIDATEVERVEAEGTDALGEVLLVQGRNVDSDPFFPQDERITVTSDPIFGFAVQFAENGETVSAIDFEEFVVEGRDGDDVIDISGLAQSDPTGLDTTLSAVRLLGGAGSDRFVTSSTSHVATVIGGEIGDSAFGGDVVELLDAGNVTVTYNDLEAFSVDYGSDASVEVDATEIERIEARGTAALGETLSIQGRSADPDPFFPQDERIILETDAIAGFIATLAENGEVITGIDFENLRIEGRAGDDVIDVSLLTTGPVSGLDAGLGALVLDGGDGSDRFAFSTASHGAIVIGGETGDASFGGDTVAIDGAGDIVVDFRGDESFAIDFDNDTVADVDATEIERIEIAAAGGNLTILGAEASGILSGDEVITLADEGVAGFVATYQNNGEAVSGIDVNQLNVDGRDGNDIIDASQLTTISGIGTLSINVATGNDSVSLGSGGVKTAIVNFEVGNPTGGDTLDLEALFNAGFADTDITLSNGINTETLNALLNGTSTTDFGSGFSVMLDTGSAVIEVAEVGLVGNAVSALDIMNIAFDGQRTIQV